MDAGLRGQDRNRYILCAVGPAFQAQRRPKLDVIGPGRYHGPIDTNGPRHGGRIVMGHKDSRTHAMNSTAAEYRALARAIAAFGTPGFYDALSEFAACSLGCSKRLVMRYSAYERPGFLFNNCMDESAVRSYASGLYRLDPLRTLSHQRPEASVVHLRTTIGPRETGHDYLEQIFRIAFIYDEIAFLLPTLGGLTIAVCCEHLSTAFDESQREHANQLLPLMVQLHQSHLQHTFMRNGTSGASDPFVNAICVLDSKGQAIFVSDGWKTHSHIRHDTLDRARHSKACGQICLPMGDDHLIHWELLDGESQLAPHGVVFTIERRSPDRISTSFDQAVAHFCASHRFTPREAQIFRLALMGFPNSSIAKRLEISVGTVKNHRWRLYSKLDITTERELFRLFLDDVVVSG
ncbi:MAG: helix-turn-helix transcriptional regulator [Roseovarius sp.]